MARTCYKSSKQQRRCKVRQEQLTLLFEGEVLCEMPALMVASEEEESVGVVDLQSPQVQYTLQGDTKDALYHAAMSPYMKTPRLEPH